MSEKRYRVGLIGCGWVSTGHMNGYRATGAADVVAASDIDPQRLEGFKEEYGTQGLHKDYRQMLKKENLDIVSICTWPAFHHDMTMAAAKAGVKAVVCEKPIALRLSEAREMTHACEQAGCKLIVPHLRRFEARFVKARELLDAGEIGRLLRVEAYHGDLFSDDHGIDLIRFYAGDVPPRWVFGQVDWRRRSNCPWGHQAEGASLGYTKFENGVEGLNLSGAVVEGHGGYSMVLTGTDGVIQIKGHNYPDESWVELMNARTGGWTRLDAPMHLIGEPKPIVLGRPTIEYYWVDSWQKLMQHAMDCLENDGDSIVGGRQATATLEIVTAIYESSRQRTVVRFPLPEEIDAPLELMEKEHNAQLGKKR